MDDLHGRVAVVGERRRVQGFALAGAVVLPAEDAPGTRAAWRGLSADVAVVVLTPAAAAALADVLPDRRRLTVVMP
jgi:vacuolar-type H+-ATPase subunit F/Vma7